MWRSILAVFLAPVLAAAQTAQTEGVPAVSSEPCKPMTQVAKHPAYQHYTYHDRIRRDRDEEAAIQLWVTGDVTTPKSQVRGIVPLNLELQPSEGLTVKNVQYPKAVAKKVKFQSEPLNVARTRDVRFKIHAGQNAALGPRVLKGKLTYQLVPMDGSAPRAVETIDVAIPVTIVEHNAKVARASYPYQHIPPALIVVLIVFAPLLLAGLILLAPFYLGCLASGVCTE